VPEVNTSVLISEAASLYEIRKYAKALNKYQEVIEIDSKSVAASAGIGACLQAQGFLDAAKQWYEFALSIDPDYKFAKDALANLNEASESELTKAPQKKEPKVQKKAPKVNTGLASVLTCPHCDTPLIIKQNTTPRAIAYMVGIVFICVGVCLTCVFFIGTPIWVVGMLIIGGSTLIQPSIVYYCPRCQRNVQFQ
jgi:tetratricopeptide (TPR) repeat protein